MQKIYLEVIAGAVLVLTVFLQGLDRPIATIFGTLLTIFVISYLLASATYFFLKNRFKYEKKKYVAVFVIALSTLSILGTLSQGGVI